MSCFHLFDWWDNRTFINDKKALYNGVWKKSEWMKYNEKVQIRCLRLCLCHWLWTGRSWFIFFWFCCLSGPANTFSSGRWLSTPQCILQYCLLQVRSLQGESPLPKYRSWWTPGYTEGKESRKTQSTSAAQSSLNTWIRFLPFMQPACQFWPEGRSVALEGLKSIVWAQCFRKGHCVVWI